MPQSCTIGVTAPYKLWIVCDPRRHKRFTKEEKLETQAEERGPKKGHLNTSSYILNSLNTGFFNKQSI